MFARQITEEPSLNGSKPSSKDSEPRTASKGPQPERPVKEAAPVNDRSRFNVIPKSRWQNGIPAVMGAHLMSSGVVAPLSTSKGEFIQQPGNWPGTIISKQLRSSRLVVVLAATLLIPFTGCRSSFPCRCHSAVARKAVSAGLRIPP